MDMISDFPKDILQRILYFLSQEDAIRTSVLSKSWRNIWCARPNLDLSDKIFKGDKQEFLFFVGNNLQRYRDQRMRLEEFGLRIFLGNYEFVSLLEKRVATLKNMGVKEFRLSIYSRRVQRRRRRYVKLPSLVFEAESLQDLHAEGFTLDQTSIGRNILCKHLKKLRLEKIEIEDGVFEKIITSCPLIETMILKSCKGIEIHPPSLETVEIEHANILIHKGAQFRNLNSVRMNDVKISSVDSFCSCKFPSLKELALSDCDGLEESIQKSHVFIDAPNMDSFVYHGFFIPSISFSTTSREWSSTLSLDFTGAPSSWLPNLHKMLESLSRSKISLTICQLCFVYDEVIIQGCLDLVQGIKGGNKPAVVVKKLLLCGNSSYFSPLLNGLLCICRPRKIGDINYTDSESVLKNLMQREGGNQDELRQLWLPDLEELRLEIYDNNRRKWDPTSFANLPEYEEGKRIRTRFALKWRENL
ncbi:hypothetical protein MIMGU_mgv1a005738mg [Erythranthe guttata]|uniref:F-box domain-containing protein n=1 Tax=Erythranthe guttata TaxID=4155 RepID=A0A022QNB1_ERYGU|nr:hypothetical protein MIMGU_mgv1a005738mg [Erythranthe guttata]